MIKGKIFCCKCCGFEYFYDNTMEITKAFCPRCNCVSIKYKEGGLINGEAYSGNYLKFKNEKRTIHW